MMHNYHKNISHINNINGQFDDILIQFTDQLIEINYIPLFIKPHPSLFRKTFFKINDE